MVKMRALGISAISLVLTAIVVGNAYYQKKQFYPSVVYITKSNPSMAVIYIQSLVLVLMLGKLMRKVFLGTLRAAEFEHLMERFWYALTETCLAFTVFRDDFNPKFVALFTVLLFLKSFHWLAEERVDYMERSPVIGALFHVRVSALLTVLGLLDYLMISHAYYSTITKGATVQLVFGFEYAILITMVANIMIKYVLHAAELRTDNPWENKAVFLLYTELVIGFIRVVLYVLFVAIMVRIYTLPLFAFRPMYYTMRNFKKALNDVILSRRAIRNMNTLYPDATPEELALSDNICIICREDMVNTSKKLPCGHIFHTACLRSWFQRQQTCPTCRLNILRTPNAQTDRQAGQAGGNINNNQPNAANANPAANNNNNSTQNNNANQNNPFANLLNQQAPNLQMPLGGSAIPQASPFNPFMMPPFGFMPGPPPPPPTFLFQAPPVPPPSFAHLTDEQLQLLEGTERRNVEERIKLLRNIQLLVDAAVALTTQYTIISARFPPPTIPTEAPPQTATSNQAEKASTSAAAGAGVEAINPFAPASDQSKNAATVQSFSDTSSSSHPTATPASAATSASANSSTDAPSSSTTTNDASATASNKNVIEPENRANNIDLKCEESTAEDAQAAELRRRRLQKFEQTN